MADLTRKTANLFDKDNTIVYSAYINTSDAWVNDSGSYSIKIPCLGSTTYTLSVGTSLPIFRLYESSDSDVEPTSYATGGTPISRIIRGENLSQYSFTTDANSVYIIFQGSASALNDWINSLMLNAGSEPLPYEPYGWVHSLRKQCSATETITTGQTIYANGQPISTYSIKGNTVQDGTPTPSNPVAVNGVGNKTANLLNPNTMTAGYAVSDSSGNLSPFANDSASDYIDVSGFTTVYIHSYQTARKWGAFYDENKVFVSGFSFYTSTQTVPQNAVYMRVTITTAKLDTAMVVKGSTVPTSYIPYGYKIPISSEGQTIDIYIGDLPLLKSLEGTAVDEISNGTLTRRVDSDGSVLPTPTTTQITMPSIPTTDGANNITVDTTVQPSEFTATWTGWHDSSVKEYDGTNWQ